jgi:hypothetical protein
MTILREVACECMRVDISVDESFYRIVDAAMALTGSPKENLQVLDREVGTLKIAAQRGFESLFLSFFAKVRDDASACAAGLRSHEQVIVDDVMTSEIFKGQASQKVMLNGGARREWWLR